MYSRIDFLVLKKLSQPELEEAMAKADEEYIQTSQYLADLEERETRRVFGKVVEGNTTRTFSNVIYPVTVSEITSKLGNVESYMTEIYKLLKHKPKVKKTRVEQLTGIKPAKNTTYPKTLKVAEKKVKEEPVEEVIPTIILPKKKKKLGVKIDLD